MKIPVYEQCCCIFSLETGCKIIGVVQAILSLLLFIYKSITIDSLIKHQPFAAEEERVPTSVLVSIAVVMILVSLLQFVLGILLFYSIDKKNMYIPKVWVCVSTTLLVSSLVLLIVMSTWVSAYAENTGAGFTNFFCGVLLLSSIAYIVNVVHSYVRRERECEQVGDCAASAPALPH